MKEESSESIANMLSSSLPSCKDAQKQGVKRDR